MANNAAIANNEKTLASENSSTLAVPLPSEI